VSATGCAAGRTPATLDPDAEGRCTVVNPDGDPPEDILCAAKECLGGAITLYDARTGQRVYPRASSG